MFNTSKYTNWYNAIIVSARASPPSSGERHHIIPKSMGGSNDQENLVLLTTRQHFICHKLLIKMTSGHLRYKMISAFSYMVFTSKNKCLSRKATSTDYKLARKLCKGMIYTPERNAKISAARKGKTQIRTEASNIKHRETLAYKKSLGYKQSKEQNAAISKGLIGNKNGVGMIITAEHKAIVSEVNSRTYTIISPDGESSKIKNLSKWLLEHNATTRSFNKQYKKGPLKGFTILSSLQS
jgi:hypothetical protein